MFAYDQAAWHATDRFQEDIQRRASNIAALQALGFDGYIVEPGEGGALLTTFYGTREGRRFALARYVVAGSTVTSGGFIEADGDKGMSLLALRLIDAREKALAAMAGTAHELCTQSRPNTLALAKKDGAISVYVLSSTTETHMYPAGGHYRFDFDANGKLTGERRFMNSCVNIDFTPKGGETPKAFVLTHLLDPQPTEIHAFVSRNVPIRLMIATTSNHALWDIVSGHIKYLQDVPEKN